MTAPCSLLTNRCKTVACAAPTGLRLAGSAATSVPATYRAADVERHDQQSRDSCDADSTAADLVEQAAQEPREHHPQAVVAGTSLGAALDVYERCHRVEDDAQMVLPWHLVRGLADAEQLTEGVSANAREELESGHGASHPSVSLQRADWACVELALRPRRRALQMLATCPSAVLVAMTSFSPIWRLLCPRATSMATSRSRLVSGAENRRPASVWLCATPALEDHHLLGVLRFVVVTSSHARRCGHCAKNSYRQLGRPPARFQVMDLFQRPRVQDRSAKASSDWQSHAALEHRCFASYAGNSPHWRRPSPIWSATISNTAGSSWAIGAPSYCMRSNSPIGSLAFATIEAMVERARWLVISPRTLRRNAGFHTQHRNYSE